MSNENITIAVKHSIWVKLNLMKKPGESFNDVIERLIAEIEQNG